MPLSIEGSVLTNLAPPFSPPWLRERIDQSSVQSTCECGNRLRRVALGWLAPNRADLFRMVSDGGAQSSWAKRPEGKCHPDIVSALALLNEKLLHKMPVSMPLQAAGLAQYRWRMAHARLSHHGVGGAVQLSHSSRRTQDLTCTFLMAAIGRCRG